MKTITVGLLLAVALAGGCRRTPAPVISTPPPSSVTKQVGIFPQPEAAEVIQQHFGFIDVLAYEVHGMWFECWLECEIDGKLAEQTAKLSIGAEQFRGDRFPPPLRASQLQGWVTLWGSDHNRMELKVRAAYRDPSSSDIRFVSHFPLALTIPEPQTSTSAKFSSGNGADVGWTGPIAIPATAGEEFVVKSWDWEESETIDGPVTRSVKVTLKARQLAD